MNKNIMLSSVLCGLCLAPFAVQANDKVQTIYDAQRYQQVCKSKSQGAQVSFAHRGIIWNGTCEPQFFSSTKNGYMQGNEREFYRACANNNGATRITVDGREIRGKCSLGFTPPQPR